MDDGTCYCIRSWPVVECPQDLWVRLKTRGLISRKGGCEVGVICVDWGGIVRGWAWTRTSEQKCSGVPTGPPVVWPYPVSEVRWPFQQLGHAGPSQRVTRPYKSIDAHVPRNSCGPHLRSSIREPTISWLVSFFYGPDQTSSYSAHSGPFKFLGLQKD